MALWVGAALPPSARLSAARRLCRSTAPVSQFRPLFRERLVAGPLVLFDMAYVKAGFQFFVCMSSGNGGRRET